MSFIEHHTQSLINSKITELCEVLSSKSEEPGYSESTRSIYSSNIINPKILGIFLARYQCHILYNSKFLNCDLQFDRPDHNIIRIIDCYMGRVNGFAYGSTQRFIRMKRKGVIKPVGPVDQYRLPPVTSNEV